MRKVLNKLIFSLCWSFLIISCAKNDAQVSDFSANEIKLITSGSNSDSLRVLNYFIQADSIILRKKSSRITDLNSPFLKLLISRMYKTVIIEQGVGIAAPQVGINKRVIWVQRHDKPSKPFEVYINPWIVSYSDTLEQRNDGCLSIPGVYGKSWRAIWVEVDYFTPDGQHIREKIKHKYTAHIFQHEIDHLEGILWIDRINKP
ncbi:MAG: peptide deformylase [Bacteroidales bacterium]|nr:peptide deformylase [Bacteroidales bacterium]